MGKLYLYRFSGMSTLMKKIPWVDWMYSYVEIIGWIQPVFRVFVIMLSYSLVKFKVKCNFFSAVNTGMCHISKWAWSSPLSFKKKKLQKCYLWYEILDFICSMSSPNWTCFFGTKLYSSSDQSKMVNAKNASPFFHETRHSNASSDMWYPHIVQTVHVLWAHLSSTAFL